MLLPALAACMLLTACIDDSILSAAQAEAGQSAKRTISFGMRQAGYSWPDETRAAIVSTSTMHSTFGVCASLYAADADAAAAAEMLYIDNACVALTRDDDTGLTDWVVNGERDYYWPGDNYTLSFYGYAPQDATGLTVSTSATDAPALHYSCPATAYQTDLLLASMPRLSGSYGQTVDLTFRHALAAVQVVEGSTMQPGSIKSIALRGLYSDGDFDYDADAWSIDASKTTTYTLTFSDGLSVKQNPGEVITPDNNCFIVLPQTLPPEASLRIIFDDAQTGLERTIDGSLAGITLAKGSRTRLIINVDANYTLGFDDESTPLDAHYVIAKLPFTVSGIADDASWTLTASASDGANVTLQRTADLNEYARQGYWTDVIYEGSTSGAATSARGTASVSGSGPGSFDFSVFIPENVSDNNRVITLTLKVDGASDDEAITKTLTQYHPAWTASGLGWEQVQDSRSTTYGFSWDRVVSYVYSYSAGRLNSSKQTQYQSYLEQIVSNNNASGFAEVGRITYTSGFINAYRYYIKIDYGKMNNLSSYGLSTSDGINNTRTIYLKGGEILTNNFENIIINTLKTESGKEDEAAFRMATASNDYSSYSAILPSGSKPAGPSTDTDTEGSAAVGEVLKKNRYYIVRTTTTEDKSTVVSLALGIKYDDIVWFLPARDQFALLPANVQEAIDASDCWSSTPLDNDSESYLGDGTAADRGDYHYVRAVRIKQ